MGSKPLRGFIAILFGALFLFAVTALSEVPRKDPTVYEETHTTWIYPPWRSSWVVVAGQKQLSLLTFGKAHFINPQGLDAVRLTAWDDPARKGDDDELCVYGVDSGENSIIYNSSMTSLGLYGYDEQGAERLNAPWDIAGTPEGLVFITDSGNRRVVRLRNVGGKLLYDGSFGAEPPAELLLPRGIDVTAGGKVVVADAGSDRVVLFDTLGVFLGAVGGFDRPVGLAAVDRSDTTVRRRGEYFVVSDSGGRRLRKCRFDGTVVFSADAARATGFPDVYLGHVEIDLFNNVIVTDSLNNCLHKFNSSLGLLASWGETGKGRGRFSGPTGISIWRRFGQTFVADRNGAHYLWVGTDLAGEPELTIDPNGPRIVLKLRLTERTRIVLQLVDAEGEVVREKTTTRDTGRQVIDWKVNAKPRRGFFGKRAKPEELPEPVLPGDYTLVLRMRATYSSRKVFENVLEAEITIPPVAADNQRGEK